jgi:lysylphosphatidylglycerol synthetase-like protein (DUF2156 family)
LLAPGLLCRLAAEIAAAVVTAAVVFVAFEVVSVVLVAHAAAVAAFVAAVAGVLAFEVVIQPLQVLFSLSALLDFQVAFAEVAWVMNADSAAAH